MNDQPANSIDNSGEKLRKVFIKFAKSPWLSNLLQRVHGLWSQTHLLSNLWPWESCLTFLSLNFHMYYIGILCGLHNICKYIYNKYAKVHFFFFIRILGRYTQRNRPLEEGPCSDLHFRLGYREGKIGEVSAQRDHSSFSSTERTDGAWEVLLYNSGSAVMKIIMRKISFKLLVKNRVSFSSAFCILILGRTIKTRNGPRIWKVNSQR